MMTLEEQWSRAFAEGCDLSHLNAAIAQKDQFTKIFNEVYDLIVVALDNLEQIDDWHPKHGKIERALNEARSILNSSIDR